MIWSYALHLESEDHQIFEFQRSLGGIFSFLLLDSDHQMPVDLFNFLVLGIFITAFKWFARQYTPFTGNYYVTLSLTKLSFDLLTSCFVSSWELVKQ